MFGVESLEALVLSLPGGTVLGMKHADDGNGIIEFSPQLKLFDFDNLKKFDAEHDENPFLGEFYSGDNNPFLTSSASIEVDGQVVAYVHWHGHNARTWFCFILGR